MVGSKVVEQVFEQRQELRRLRPIGSRFVVVARQQQRDRHVPHGVAHDGPVCDASLFARPVGAAARAAGVRQSDALPSQVILDAEGHRALEAGRGEDVARMTVIGEPLHDRPQALRDAGGWIADAVVIDQEKPHN